MGTGPLRQKPEPLISDGLRALFAIAAGLEILAGVSLYIFADRTADWFAWTLEPPLTAAFLGAVYWATLGPVLYAVIDRRWVRARAAVPRRWRSPCRWSSRQRRTWTAFTLPAPA